MFFENLDKLNNKNYEVFLKFYEDYNDIIKAISIDSNFFISFYNSKTNNFISSKSLDELIIYMQNFTKNEYDSANQEKIIGTTLDSKTKKLSFDRRKNG